MLPRAMVDETAELAARAVGADLAANALRERQQALMLLARSVRGQVRSYKGFRQEVDV